MNNKKILYAGLFFLLIILSIFPRATEVINKNYVFLFDQGRDYLDVQKIVEKHKFTLIGAEIGAGSAGFKYIFHGPGYYYLLTIPYILFRGDPYGGVVLMFLLGLISIGLAFYMGNKILGKWGGVVFALMIAVSSPLIDQSRFIWNSYPATSLIILTYYFVYLTVKKSRNFLFLAAFSSAFIYNFELGMAVPMALSVFIFSILILKNKNLKAFLLMFLGFILGFLPMLLFEIRHGFLAFKSILAYIFSVSTNTPRPNFLFYQSDHLNSFKYNFINAFPSLNFPIFYALLFILVFSISLYLVIKEKNAALKKLLIYLFSLPVITYLILCFLKNAVWQHYLYHLLIGYLFIFTYALIVSDKNHLRLFKYLLSIFLIVFLYKGLLHAKEVYFQDYSNYYGGTAKIKGKIDALDYIYKDAKGEKFGLFVFAPPIYTYPFDYLLSWYGMKKYNYVPHHEKKGLFYLLIEKDGERPWADKGWMETVIKTGKVLETKTLKPSNFIIQKRFQE